MAPRRSRNAVEPVRPTWCPPAPGLPRLRRPCCPDTPASSTGSIADITFVLEKPTSVDEVNGIFREEAASERYRGIIEVTEDALVSSDIIGLERAAVIALPLTRVIDGDLLKVFAWYDNEWGYVSQMIREAERVTQ